MSRLGFGRGQLIGLALGLPVMAYGIRGAVVDSRLTHPAELGRWVVGAAVVHDALLLPVVLLASLVVGRLAPPWARPPALWAVATSAVIALYAWPFVRGYGENPSVPSLLARDYLAGLISYIAAVALIGTAWALLRRRSATAGAAAAHDEPVPPAVDGLRT